MTYGTYIRSITDNVSDYTRNYNEILTQELLYEGAAPADADSADYFGNIPTLKAVRLG